MRNELMQKHSNCSIIGLFGRSPAGQNVLICIYLLFMFRLLPYAVAQNSNQPPAVAPHLKTNTYLISGKIGLVFMISAFFLFFFISLFIYKCSRTRTDESIRRNGVEERISCGGNRGLDPAVIETFSTFAYSHVKDHKLGNGALECAVCLNEFVDDDTIRLLLPNCDHVFHPDCIDAWLSKRTTCPVCRVNLVPVTGETPETMVPVQEIEGDSYGEIPTSKPVDVENEQVSINVLSEEPEVVAVAPEVINQTPMQNRQVRYAARFLRSHSTGHSLVQPGEDVERFTLRLPDEVRKQIMNMRQVNQTRSMVAFPVLLNPKKGYLTTGEGSSRGGKSMEENRKAGSSR
ncbi:E3 ubiquitin-protein ligase ATL6-like [Telopea speciosissima]|uniref:E3 ubiquitin-protein ligase ATL6-like n=1 Tax=Telopea speciosissima TaxID=54955 RepID=UPI001CC3B171|nr:E3 ubiquitin-protein ligase ATL6-like [Telopea speciosissima]